MRTALVLGGALCVWQDAEAALAMFRPDATFAVNDAIPRWRGHLDHAVTLHFERLKWWVRARALAGLSGPDVCWTTRQVPPDPAFRFRGVDRLLVDRNMSSGGLAVEAALAAGFDKVVVCGVPLDSAGGHLVRGSRERWRGAHYYQRGWLRRLRHFAPRVRSMSGWTRATLGPPTPEWLAQEDPTWD